MLLSLPVDEGGQRMEEQGSQSSGGLLGAVAPSSTAALRKQLRDNSLGCLVTLDEDHLGGYLRADVLTAWLFVYRHSVSLCSPGWPQTPDPA